MASSGTRIGAAIAPTAVALLMMPVAVALSSAGNKSAITFMHPGKLAASPAPKTNLATPNPIVVRASTCPISASDQTNTASARPNRAPMRSRILPAAIIISA